MADDEITAEELEALLASAYDEQGNDRWLPEEIARMTPEQRRAARTNVDRWVARARATIRERRRDV